MKYVLDVHTHTIASGHAYNTIREMTQSAAQKGLELLGITEHGIAMQGTCTEFYFDNTKMLERHMAGIEVLFGVEANIMDYHGKIDMPERLLKRMDIVIASLHVPCLKPGTREENTNAYLEVIKNPYVDIIGHPDDGRYPVDYLALVQAAKEYGKLLEVNNNSLDPRCSRENGEENVKTMLRYCMEYRSPVVLDSDAHTDALVGCRCFSEKIVEEIQFPEELIVNGSVQEIRKYVQKYKR